MGRTPIPRIPPPVDDEAYYLSAARDAYVAGEIDLDRFEELVEHIIQGGWLCGLQTSTWRKQGLLPRDPSNKATR